MHSSFTIARRQSTRCLLTRAKYKSTVRMCWSTNISEKDPHLTVPMLEATTATPTSPAAAVALETTLLVALVEREEEGDPAVEEEEAGAEE